MSDATEAEVEVVARALAQMARETIAALDAVRGGELTMSDAEVLAASLREAVYHVTGRTMTLPQAYVVAKFLLAAGWTRPDTEGTTQLAAKVEALRQAAEVVVLDAGDEATGPEPDPNLAELAHCVAALAGGRPVDVQEVTK